MSSTLDLHSYLQSTWFSVGQGLTVASQLVINAPDRLEEKERAALSILESAIAGLREALRARVVPDFERTRPFRDRLVSAWIALRSALDAHARLIGTEDQVRAEALLAKVLPNGTEFLSFRVVELWPVSETLLTRVDELGLTGEIDDLVGPSFLVHLRAAQHGLTDVLGVSVRRNTSSPSVRDALDALSDALVRWGHAMVGWIDLDDAESVAAFKLAMGPLDEHRARLARRGANGDLEDVEVPSEPVLDQPTEEPGAPAPDPQV